MSSGKCIFKFYITLLKMKLFARLRIYLYSWNEMFIKSIIFFVCIILLQGFIKDSRKSLKNYVVLISFDAFRWDYCKLYSTPNLDRMASEGVKADRLIPAFPTKTFPNHYTIITGLYPDNHGIIDNNFSAPDLGLFYRTGDRLAVENPAFYGGEPLWATAEKQGVRAASFFWVGSESSAGGKYPSYWKKYDGSVAYEARIDTVIKWLGYPETKRPGFISLYFEEPDLTSHDYGPVSNETGKIVTALDSIVGVIRFKLSTLPHAKRINLIVLSDHGIGPVSPERYINIRGVVPERMIASVSGGNPVYLINPNKGKGDSVLYLLNSVKGMKAWRKSELPARLHFGKNQRIPEIVVVADSSWSLGTRRDGSSIKGGVHGYDNANSDMHSIFYATGPAFKKGYEIKELNNVDIYNLICRILDISPARNDGDPKHIKSILR